MAGYKETPRQKMIAMMYLVLTALLALNVSKEMLNAFLVVNDSVELTNENFTKKLEDTFKAFEKKYQNDQVKVKPFFDKANQARKLSNAMISYVDSIKYELISLTEKVPLDTAKILNLNEVKNKDDYDTPTNYFFRGSEDGSKGAGKDLKNRIDDFREAMYSLLNEEERDRVKIGLQTDGDYHDADGASQNWIQYNFYQTILAADVAILNKIKTEVYNAEFDIVNYLLVAVDAKDFKYDKIAAKILPKRKYIFIGEDYEAEAIVAAYSTTQSPEVFIKMGVDSLPVSQMASAMQVDGEKGLVKFKLPGTTEGVNKYAGFIRVRSGTGDINTHYFNDEYTVARPSLTVSPTKMNVFYIGVENPVDISSAGIPDEKLTPKINIGKLYKNEAGNGWLVKVDKKPQGNVEAIISVTAEIDGEIKKMGEMNFRLKKVPPPTAKVAGVMEGNVDRDDLLFAPVVIAEKAEGFDFDLSFTIVSFDMVMSVGENSIRNSSNSGRFSDVMIRDITNSRKGQRITFERIVARGPDGQDVPLNPINLTIK